MVCANFEGTFKVFYDVQEFLICIPQDKIYKACNNDNNYLFLYPNRYSLV